MAKRHPAAPYDTAPTPEGTVRTVRGNRLNTRAPGPVRDAAGDAPTCQHCGGSLAALHRGRPRTFCSDRCRRRAFREKLHDPQVTVPRALLDSLGTFLSRLGGAQASSVARALLRHDFRRAAQLLDKVAGQR